MQVEQEPCVQFHLMQLLATVLQGLVDDPNPIVIRTTEQGAQITFLVLVPRSDMGKVVGVNGRMARCLRTFMGAAARKYKYTCALDLQVKEGMTA